MDKNISSRSQARATVGCAQEFLPLNSTLANHMTSSGVLFVAGSMAVVTLVFLGREIVLLHHLSCRNWNFFMRYDEGVAPSAGSRSHQKVAVEP